MQAGAVRSAVAALAAVLTPFARSPTLWRSCRIPKYVAGKNKKGVTDRGGAYVEGLSIRRHSLTQGGLKNAGILLLEPPLLIRSLLR